MIREFKKPETNNTAYVILAAVVVIAVLVMLANGGKDIAVTASYFLGTVSALILICAPMFIWQETRKTRMLMERMLTAIENSRAVTIDGNSARKTEGCRSVYEIRGPTRP